MVTFEIFFLFPLLLPSLTFFPAKSFSVVKCHDFLSQLQQPAPQSQGVQFKSVSFKDSIVCLLV